MEKIIFGRPKDVSEALRQGKKLVIFEVDGAGNPILPISEIKQENIGFLPKNRDIVQPAFKYIQEHYDKALRLDMLAGICDLSKSYFCRLFKEACGKSVQEYIISLRLAEACRLLTSTDRSVVGIAVEVGYVDCGYFHKLFKKHVGCTPLEYRRDPGFLVR